jgi:hypothetical protein
VDGCGDNRITTQRGQAGEAAQPKSEKRLVREEASPKRASTWVVGARENI